MKNLKLRIGGVPEHFNLPWHLAINSGTLTTMGIEATWKDFPSGTGSMVRALNNNEVDVAMLLTEGAVHAHAQGGDFDIVSVYTQSPLIWGVHVPQNSDLLKLKDIHKAKFAISRLGSGSHLMAYLLAKQENITLQENSFEIIKDLHGARERFKRGGNIVFLWEKFMTQPYVDKGEFRRIATLPTPWPCFVVCVRKELHAQAQEKIQLMLNTVLNTAQELKDSPIATKLLASEYSLAVQATREWLSLTHWAQKANIDDKLLQKVHKKLAELNLIEE